MCDKTEPDRLEKRNRKIIRAILEKAERVCPGALALIGINGSFMTGDYYEKSDLDLLLVIHNDRGRQLETAFIQEDLQIGHDLYCTSWESLQQDAEYTHPNISKLMDAKIVYCAGEEYRERLNALRKRAADILSAPFSPADYAKAEKLLRTAEHYYTLAMVSACRSDVLAGAGGSVYYIENAVAMLNKRYFRYGVKRAYEELNAMPVKPDRLCEMIESVLSAPSVAQIRQRLSLLMRETAAVFRSTEKRIAAQKKPADGQAIAGTLEEMFSNWRNKLYAAADTGNRHLAFMSLVSANAMFSEIESEAAISRYRPLETYDPENLSKTAHAYDGILRDYQEEYAKAGIRVNRYADIDAFAAAYLAGVPEK